MVLYYAVGGGLGHLTRARAVLHTLGFERPVALLSASAHAHDPRVTGGLSVIDYPANLERLAPDELIVDAFPGGVVGELCGLRLPRLRHVARRLRWDAYSRRLRGRRLPRFDVSYILEPLEPAHAEALERCSDRIEPLALVDPPAPPFAELGPGPLWLVVHSGPMDEVEELVRYALDQRAIERSDARVIVASGNAPLGVETLDVYPAAALFPLAERIFTACGFNVMRQAEPFGHRHRFIPFPRALDDQFFRARAARSRRAA